MDRRTLLQAGTGFAATAAWLAGCSGDSGQAAASSRARDGNRDHSRTRGPRSDRPGRHGTPADAPRAGDWSALARGLGGGLVRPGDVDYTSARRLYNTRFDHLRPAAVAYVSGTADIAECLAFARRHAVPVAIRNGGHSYAGWSSGTGRLVIDVSRLDRVAVTGRAEAVIGAGAKLIDIYTRLGARGVTVPGGTCPTVGISGLTLGGGHGVVSRAYGLTCDSLLAATLVTADGRTLRCDAADHRDLFWALRGAGNGNFGVVTELRFRTHRPPAVVAARLNWPWGKAADVVRAWQEWGPEQPDEIWSAVHLAAVAGGSPRVAVSAFSLGAYRDLQNAVDRLADRVGASASSVSLRGSTYPEAMDAYAGCASYTADQCHLPGSTPGRRPVGSLVRKTYASRSDFYDRPLGPEGIRILIDRVERYGRAGGSGPGPEAGAGPELGSGSGTIVLTALGGAINRVAPTATAFVHRRSRVLAQYLAAWRAGRSGSAATAWLNDLHRAMRRHASGAAYQNYTDPALKDWRRAYYGPAAHRLTRLKRQYDPERVFDFPQAL
ncbi:FAD-binding oxidoreductase [Streptomyces sp. 7N604]|uniref:FAD-binding oxidoreductase n=1 Tax=Streptomyces sp. 7N604 TaxID=3457415 RepID=UPI003FCFB2CC